MFSWRQKKPRRPASTPPWLALLALGVIVFATIKGFSPSAQAPGDATPPPKVIDFNGFREKVFPAAMGQPKAETIKSGEGAPLFCGQEATVRIIPVSPAGDAETKMLRADDEGNPLLLQAILGLRKGGVRQVTLPATSPIPDSPPPASVTGPIVQVELHEMSPDLTALFTLPDTVLAPRQLDMRHGRGNVAACGDQVTVHIRLWNGDGTLRFDSRALEGAKPLSFRLGAGEAMFGLENGMLGMLQGGVRTLIIPPAWQKRLSAFGATADAPQTAVQTQTLLPESGLGEALILADVEMIEVRPANMPIPPSPVEEKTGKDTSSSPAAPLTEGAQQP